MTVMMMIIVYSILKLTELSMRFTSLSFIHIIQGYGKELGWLKSDDKASTGLKHVRTSWHENGLVIWAQAFG